MRTRPLTILTLALYAACRLALPAAPPSTALIYQGRLTEGTNVSNGLYDLQFALYDAPDGGNLVAGPVTNYLTSVTDGRSNSLVLSGPNSALGSYPSLMGDYYAGLDLLNRTNATGIVVYQPGSLVFAQDTGLASTIPANAGNFTILKGGYYDDECSGGNVTFVSIGLGLDAQQANALIAAVNALQTALGRNAAGQ